MTNSDKLGINVVHCPVEKALELGLGRVEVCLKRGDDPKAVREQAFRAIDAAKTAKLPFSIHLPLLLPSWYQQDFLSAFYLDPDVQMQELSWKMIGENLRELGKSGADYGVLHFCGIYDQGHLEFGKRLESALERLNALAVENGMKVLIEYFGSNGNWWHYEDWVKALAPYPGLGLLIDTGHLYFAAKLRGFDYLKALEWLKNHAEAYHFWTVFGDGIYGNSEAYKKWHHIAPWKEQKTEDGWAFDAEKVLGILRSSEKPVVLEGAPHYGGTKYYYDSIAWCQAYYSE